jgi:hypothetical protein
MERPEFTTTDVFKAQTELYRSLVLLLIGKKLISMQEAMLMGTYAKQCLLNANAGVGACAYVDMILRNLEEPKFQA